MSDKKDGTAFVLEPTGEKLLKTDDWENNPPTWKPIKLADEDEVFTDFEIKYNEDYTVINHYRLESSERVYIGRNDGNGGIVWEVVER